MTANTICYTWLIDPKSKRILKRQNQFNRSGNFNGWITNEWILSSGGVPSGKVFDQWGYRVQLPPLNADSTTMFITVSQDITGTGNGSQLMRTNDLQTEEVVLNSTSQ